MNVKCIFCKGKGLLSRDGKHIGNRQPFDVVCPSCNGVGHYREREWRSERSVPSKEGVPA